MIIKKVIVFEGPDGSGKTTQVEHLAKHMQNLGFKVMCKKLPSPKILNILENPEISQADKVSHCLIDYIFILNSFLIDESAEFLILDRSPIVSARIYNLQLAEDYEKARILYGLNNVDDIMHGEDVPLEYHYFIFNKKENWRAEENSFEQMHNRELITDFYCNYKHHRTGDGVYMVYETGNESIEYTQYSIFKKVLNYVAR